MFVGLHFSVALCCLFNNDGDAADVSPMFAICKELGTGCEVTRSVAVAFRGLVVVDIEEVKPVDAVAVSMNVVIAAFSMADGNGGEDAHPLSERLWRRRHGGDGGFCSHH